MQYLGTPYVWGGGHGQPLSVLGSGAVSPARFSACNAPLAIMSLAANTASGGMSSRSTCAPPLGSRWITTRLMRQFGVDVATPDPSSFVVPATAGYRSPGDVHVEGDASAASYLPESSAASSSRSSATCEPRCSKDAVPGSN